MSYIFGHQSSTLSGSSDSNRIVDGLQLDEWEVPASLFIMDRKLGEGAFGEVYRCIVSSDYDSPRFKARLQCKDKPFVAVKLLKRMSCKKYVVCNCQNMRCLKGDLESLFSCSTNTKTSHIFPLCTFLPST